MKIGVVLPEAREQQRLRTTTGSRRGSWNTSSLMAAKGSNFVNALISLPGQTDTGHQCQWECGEFQRVSDAPSKVSLSASPTQKTAAD